MFNKKSQDALILVRQIMIARPKSVTVERIFTFTFDMKLYLAVIIVENVMPAATDYFMFSIVDPENYIFLHGLDDQHSN